MLQYCNWDLTADTSGTIPLKCSGDPSICGMTVPYQYHMMLVSHTAVLCYSYHQYHHITATMIIATIVVAIMIATTGGVAAGCLLLLLLPAATTAMMLFLFLVPHIYSPFSQFLDSYDCYQYHHNHSSSFLCCCSLFPTYTYSVTALLGAMIGTTASISMAFDLLPQLIFVVSCQSLGSCLRLRDFSVSGQNPVSGTPSSPSGYQQLVSSPSRHFLPMHNKAAQ